MSAFGESVAAARSAIADTFDNDVATVLRTQQERDGGGGQRTFTAYVATIRGRLRRPSKSIVEVEAGAVRETQSWEFSLKPGQFDVCIEDKLEIGTRVFSVSGTDEGKSNALRIVLMLTEETR